MREEAAVYSIQVFMKLSTLSVMRGIALWHGFLYQALAVTGLIAIRIMLNWRKPLEPVIGHLIYWCTDYFEKHFDPWISANLGWVSLI